MVGGIAVFEYPFWKINSNKIYEYKLEEFNKLIFN